MIMNQIDLYSLFHCIPDVNTTLLILFTLYLVKYYLNTSFITAIGLFLIHILLKSEDYYKFASYFMLGGLYAAETISCISFDFNSCNVQSESHKSNKFYHRIVIIANVVAVNLLRKHHWLHLVSFFLYYLLFYLRRIH